MELRDKNLGPFQYEGRLVTYDNSLDKGPVESQYDMFRYYTIMHTVRQQT